VDGPLSDRHGYNDDKQIFQVKDSYEKGGELLSVPYDDMIRGWRSFNYAFIVIFPPEREERTADPAWSICG
jgi:hypothetical protein